MNARDLKRRFSAILRIVAVVVFVLVMAFAGPSEQGLNMGHPKVKEVAAIQEAVTPGLMSSMEDVLGTAVTLDNDGEVAMVVYVNLEGKNPAKTARELPNNIGGVRVSVEVTEPFRSMVGKPTSGGVSHTVKQT